LVNIDFDPISGLSIPNLIDKNNLTIHIDGFTPWQDDMTIALASRDNQVYCKWIKYDVQVKEYFDLSAKEC